MPWKKNTWVDDDGSLTVGTPFDAAHMNNIEELGTDLATANVTLGNHSASITAIAASAGKTNALASAASAGALAASAAALGASAGAVAASKLGGSALTTGQNANKLAATAEAGALQAEAAAGNAEVVAVEARNDALVAEVAAENAGGLAASALATGQGANVVAASGLKAAGSAIAIGTLRTDYGIVTTLPKAPKLRDVCHFIADATNNIIWDLEYDARSETYPWRKVGGPALRKVEATTRESGTGGAIETTGAPSLTTPLKGEYRGRYGAAQAHISSVGSSPATEGSCLLYVNGASVETFGTVGANQFEGSPMEIGFETRQIEAGKVVQTRYSSNNGRSFQFVRLFVELNPIRVG